MKERRQYKRFFFPLPVRLKTIAADKETVLDLVTRDISASGTFIPTLTYFPEGTRFILDFTIPSNEISKLKKVKSLRGYKGNMVRSTPFGLAIQFDKECQIESIKAL